MVVLFKILINMRYTLIIVFIFFSLASGAQTTDPFAPWLDGKPPVVAEELGVEMHSDSIRVRKLVFRSRDNGTVYAAIAYPAGKGPFPGLLRLHGGGGFADIPAAVSSAKSGYVSLVLDQPGVAGEKSRNPKTTGAWKGRPMITAKPDATYSALFDAVLASVQALYLLRAQPEVNKSKLCVAGASWGGYIATMVAALCNKDLKATWSVFGSGHFELGAYEKDRIMKLPAEERALWQRWLDPASRAHQITKPYFISTASNDRHWSWMAVQATLADMKGPVNQFYSPNDNHGMNYPGAKYMIHYFNHYVKGTEPELPVIIQQKSNKEQVSFAVQHALDIVQAEIWYAPADTLWTQKKWIKTKAVKQGDHYVATLPANAKINWYPVIRSVYGKDTIASAGLIKEMHIAIKPLVFNAGETAGRGAIFGMQGAYFGPAPEVWYGDTKPTGTIKIISASDRNITAQLPDTLKQQIIAIWIKNAAGYSKPIYLNKPRAVSIEYDELQPGQAFRIFGRNLTNAYVQLQPVKGGAALKAAVTSSDPYILNCIAPANLQNGKQYRILVSDHPAEELITGRSAGKDPFKLKVPWGSDFSFSEKIYNVKTDERLTTKASGDGMSDDRTSIQQAIDLAHRNGGGVVYLPAGKYRLDIPSGSGLVMRSKVVLQGDGPSNTIIQYGFGTPPPYANPIGKGGWPDSTTDGVAILWPLHTTLTGLYNLQVQNVNSSGAWRHSLKNMRPPILKPGAAGSKFFVSNCKFDLSVAWGLSWGYVDRMVITDCWFQSTAQVTWPWMWHCNGSTNFVVRNNQFRYSAGRFGFNEAFNGIIENNHITRLGDLQTAKGETGGFNIDYSSDIIVLNNRMDVEGRDIEYHNQGETILSQGGDPKNMDAGIVSSATATSISDASKKWKTIRTDNLSTCDAIAIVDGKGAGQWRRIVKNNSTTITVSEPWELIPDASSHYVITRWSAEDWLVRGNILEGNNRGIWFYCGNADVSIVDNKLINSEGIYLRADQRLVKGRYNLSWNTYVADNIVINNNGLRPAFVCNTLTVVTPDSLHGLGCIGIEIRRNYVEAHQPNSGSFVRGEGYFNEVDAKFKVRGSTMGIIGTIFEQNKVVNADTGYRLSTHIAQTVIKEPVYRNVKANGTNAIFMQEPAGDPFAQYLDGKAPKVTQVLSDSGGIRRLLFHSRDVNGIPTLIHAAVIRPAAPGNYPGLLILHGGGGSAEIDKGIKWARQGYIVVTLDLPGIADGKKLKLSSGYWKDLAYGSKRFASIGNSTIFDAVLAALQGLYLLREQPGVTNIGVTGVSWGGYMTTMLSGLAPSYIDAAFSTYGSGFYDSGSTFLKDLDTMRAEERAAWLQYLDAGRRAKNIAAPFFIAAASNDNWFYPPAVLATLNGSDAPVNHFFAANANHAAPVPGGNSVKERIGTMDMELAYFNYYLKGEGLPLPVINSEITKDSSAQFYVDSKTPIKTVTVYYSTDSIWTKRKWIAAEAFPLKDKPGWYTAALPDSAKAKGSYWFASATDTRPLTVSGKMISYE
jgi:dienelactone hydrolase